MDRIWDGRASCASIAAAGPLGAGSGENNNETRISLGFGVLLAAGAACAGVAVSAWAQDGGAYLRDNQGNVVRSSDFGNARIGNLCWRTGYWTPQESPGGCELGMVDPPPLDPPAPPRPNPPVKEPDPPFDPKKVTFALEIFFDVNKSVIKPEAKETLDSLLAKMQGLEIGSVVAIGHADGTGGNVYNDKLSLQRAKVVKAYLVGKGVDRKRIFVFAKGKHEPLADDATPRGRARNRRVEIYVD